MSHDPANLYREQLLSHSRDPRNAGRVDAPTHQGRADNPLCGDVVELTLLVNEDCIQALRHQVRGCVIAQAAASMMSEVMQGMPLEQALKLGREFTEAMTAQAPSPIAAPDNPNVTLPEALADLRPLLEVRKHRSRIACALLAWKALEAALKEEG